MQSLLQSLARIAVSHSTRALVCLVLLAVLLCAAACRIMLRRRISPEETERRRREALSADGVTGDAMLGDTHEGIISYSYQVRGVEYSASQDVSTLQHLLPGEADRLIGPALVKYDARNPGNSIVISELWTGLRKAARPTYPKKINQGQSNEKSIRDV